VKLRISCSQCGTIINWKLKSASDDGSLQLIDAPPCTHCQGKDAGRVKQLEDLNEQLQTTVLKLETQVSQLKREATKW